MVVNHLFPVHTNLEVPQYRAVITLDIIREEEANHGTMAELKEDIKVEQGEELIITMVWEKIFVPLIGIRCHSNLSLKCFTCLNSTKTTPKKKSRNINKINLYSYKPSTPTSPIL